MSMHRMVLIVRNADYMISQFQGRLYNMRSDYWKPDGYEKGLQKVLDRFLAEHPEFACQLEYQPGGAAPITDSLRIYPEQYRSNEGACIDGAVKFATPPMGARITPDYYQLTHGYELVWNTPGFTRDGFVYWDEHGFMKRSFNWKEIDTYARG